jgi:hypothetical protein
MTTQFITPAYQLRACFHCAHARHEGAPRCWHPSLVRGRGPVPITEARDAGASCGPEAHLMEFRHATNKAPD